MRWDRILLLLTLQLSLFCCTSAQDQLLWRVSRPGEAKHGWLMGTVHEFPKEVIAFDSSIFPLICEASGLVLESEMTFKMIANYLFVPGKKVVYGSGGEMNDNVANALYNFFVNGGRVDETSFEQLLQSKTVNSLEALCYATYGIKKDFGGMEEQLRQAAVRFSKPVSGLDKNLREINSWFAHYYAFEMAEWESPSTDSLVAAKFYSVGNLFSAYGIQDTAVIYATGNRDIFQDGLSLVAWRNTNWMKQLPQLFNEGNFVAVGAAHLHGANGLLNLLRQAGYVLTPITTNFRGEKFWRFMQRYSSIYELQ